MATGTQGFITCAWFFGPQGVVEISPLYYREHHNVTILRSYSTLACVPISQGQAIPALPTNSSTISVQGGDISEQRDGNREMRFFDHMERRAIFMMDEEESRQVNVPACDESLLEEHVNPWILLCFYCRCVTLYEGCIRNGACPCQHDRKTIPFNPPSDWSIHRARFHNFISPFIKEECCFGSICGGIFGGFGPDGGLGSKEYV